ncbi:hypothetical protein CF5_0099 [Staphylococcus phage CF5]|uniref:Transposase n=1 Tax=Staphylococcus phage CF5 TaxID=3113739 RepID=A0AAX4J718_9CAUD|nr:hypothetical protein CF5_0099 [Staphylococcus phage CF5]
MKIFYSGRRTTCQSRQKKKHYTQMTKIEIYKCQELVKQAYGVNNRFVLTNHFKKRVKNKVNFNALTYFLHRNKIDVIEYNETLYHGNIHRRLLIRHPYVVRLRGQLSFQYMVIDIETGEIITTYYNRVNDTHQTLDLSNYYNKNLIIKC